MVQRVPRRAVEVARAQGQHARGRVHGGDRARRASVIMLRGSTPEALGPRGLAGSPPEEHRPSVTRAPRERKRPRGSSPRALVLLRERSELELDAHLDSVVEEAAFIGRQAKSTPSRVPPISIPAQPPSAQPENRSSPESNCTLSLPVVASNVARDRAQVRARSSRIPAVHSIRAPPDTLSPTKLLFWNAPSALSWFWELSTSVYEAPSEKYDGISNDDDVALSVRGGRTDPSPAEAGLTRTEPCPVELHAGAEVLHDDPRFSSPFHPVEVLHPEVERDSRGRLVDGSPRSRSSSCTPNFTRSVNSRAPERPETVKVGLMTSPVPSGAASVVTMMSPTQSTFTLKPTAPKPPTLMRSPPEVDASVREPRWLLNMASVPLMPASPAGFQNSASTPVDGSNHRAAERRAARSHRDPHFECTAGALALVRTRMRRSGSSRAGGPSTSSAIIRGRHHSGALVEHDHRT